MPSNSRHTRYSKCFQYSPSSISVCRLATESSGGQRNEVMLAFRPLERWVRRHSYLRTRAGRSLNLIGKPKLKVPRAPRFFSVSHITFARRMTWQSKTRTSISNNSNRNLLVWTRSPSKSRRQKSRKWPAGTKMTAKTTIRAIGDNPEPIARTTEFSATRANPRRRRKARQRNGRRSAQPRDRIAAELLRRNRAAPRVSPFDRPCEHQRELVAVTRPGGVLAVIDFPPPFFWSRGSLAFRRKRSSMKSPPAASSRSG
jgi:hypothetical protein